MGETFKVAAVDAPSSISRTLVDATLLRVSAITPTATFFDLRESHFSASIILILEHRFSPNLLSWVIPEVVPVGPR